MEAQLKAKWVEALRSGEYKQGTNYLNARGAFCCLGVLCDLSGEGHWVPEAHPDLGYINKYVIAGAGLRACLPTSIERKYEIRDSGQLISMNDGGKSFAEIADYIEANL